LTSIYRYALSLNAQHVAIVSNFPTKHIISESDKLTVVREFQMAMKKLGVDLIDVVEVTEEVKPYSIFNKL
jgi:DNA repair protein RadC